MRLRQSISQLVFVIALVALNLNGQNAVAKNPIPLTKGDRSLSVIVYPNDCALSARTARKLSDYIKEQTDVTVPIIPGNKFKKPGRGTTVILLDGTREHRLANQFKQRIEIPSRRDDAYHLKVLDSRSTSPLVLLAGKTPEGAKYAAYHLMRVLEINGGNASIKPMNVKAEPFIKKRSVALFNVWSMPIELTRRHNTESWPVDELKRYLDMYDFFGFNAIETHDRFNDNYLRPLFGLERAQWRDKVQAMCDHAHANGQKVFLRIWGHSVMETPALAQLGPNSSVPKKLAYFCVNDPEERARWENEILNYYVTNYAGRIDNLIGHWCDPGVCRRNGCDFKTPLKLQMELHKAFKAKDPKFNSTFSMWFFDVTKNNQRAYARGGWPGYENDFDLINAGILDKEVMIATATVQPGSYKDHIVKAILAAGHKPALWTWYRADNEIRPSLHIHLHERLGEYFKGLPASAKQLEWHSIERNVHKAANTANYYVAGRLMWEPELNVDDLLKEFLVLTFGSENADRVMPAYLAIANIRCHSCYGNHDGARTTGVGTNDPEKDFKNAQEALAKLAQAKIDPKFRPRIPLDISPAQIIADLTASLEVIRDYANCRAVELPQLDKALKQGDLAAVEKSLDQLSDRYSAWSLTLAGRQEWGLLDAEIKKARTDLKRGGPAALKE